MGPTIVRSMILAAGASLLACHPLGIDDASETDTVVTRKAKDYDYSANLTYDMPDTIADLCTIDGSKLPDGGSAGEGSRPNLDCNEITHAFDTTILKEIAREFEALGYRRVDSAAGEKPDVAMLVGALASNNWVAYSYYPWYPYYGGWPPYYGWGIYYPYYPATSVVNYPTGTLMMELVSLKDADTDNQRTPSIWSGAISGLLAQGETTAATRINTGIDQAFAQSPYLKVGNQ
jgi:hypothetical protein